MENTKNKTLEFRTSKGEFYIMEHKNYIQLYDKGIKLSEITEEQCDDIVESGDAEPNSDRFKLGYKTYVTNENDYWCETAKESFCSLLESLGVCWDEDIIISHDMKRYGETPINPIYLSAEEYIVLQLHSKIFIRDRTYLYKK